MNKDFQGALCFAISALCIFVAFEYMAYDLMIFSLSASSLESNLILLAAGILAAFAGVFSGSVFSYVAYKFYKVSKQS